LGIDLGTSGLKLTLLGEDGTVVAEAEAASYDVHAPRPGHAETDPQEWAAALEAAAAQLSRNLTLAGIDVTLKAIGVTGQMHGVVLTDVAGEPVRPAILWPDQRASESLDPWMEMDADARSRLSNPVVAGMPGPILTWLQRFEPESLQTTTRLSFPKDWLRGQLTGDKVTERTDASATLLWDVAADDWSSEALDLAGLSTAQIPPVVASDEVVGQVGETPYSNQFIDFGWLGTPVVAGASDGASLLTALKQSRVAASWEKALIVNLGTGIQVLQPQAEPLPRHGPLTHLYADSDGGWYEMVAIQNGGLALDWVQRVLGLDWDTFVNAARSAPVGSAGATFTPFLTGERGLIARPDAKGGWSALTPSVGRDELARSSFEALAFTVRLGVEAVNASATTILLSGGGARDPWIRQLLCDALERPTRYVPLRSASAVGAAALAARGVGSRLMIATDPLHNEPSGDRDQTARYDHWLSAVTR
jgi:xylulokinase